MVTRQFLTKDQLKEKVPAIFAKGPSDQVSKRYNFISTENIVDNFAKINWFPTVAKTSRTKNEDGKMYQKHMIRFAQKRQDLIVGDTIPEIVVYNSHNRSFALKIEMGLFRLVCSNGLTVADSSFSQISQKHINVDFEYIQEITIKAAKEFKSLSKRIEEYKMIQLTEVEKNKFAYVARNAHWGEKSIVDPKLLLNTRRVEDEKNDIWSVFNTIQENVIKGGISYVGQNAEGKARHRRTKEIKNIARDLKINQTLWAIMNGFAINRKF